MCGRYNIITDAQALMDAFDILYNTEPEEAVTSFNIAPTQRVPVITDTPDGRKLSRMRWGLIPNWNKDTSPKFTPFNAKAETIAEKPFFRGPFKSKRCLVPASGFYEWQKQESGKTPYHVRLKNQDLFAFAGLWDCWESPTGEINSCTILTTDANQLIQGIHSRMPVILAADNYQKWLDCTQFNKQRLLSLLEPYASDNMEAYVISDRVNNARNNSSDLIEPLNKE
jgi:putative SOS response-associated peptidase YedK